MLDPLPSVPSVVLPNMSLVETDQAHLLLNADNYRPEILVFGPKVQIDQSAPGARTESSNLT